MAAMPNSELSDDDIVWIRADAEISVSGVDTVTEYVAYRRTEWESMNAQEQRAATDAAADAVLERLGVSYGADVVEPEFVAEISAAERAAAIEAMPRS